MSVVRAPVFAGLRSAENRHTKIERHGLVPVYGKGFDTKTSKVGTGSLSVCWFLQFLFRVLWVPGRLSYPSGSILGSVLMWRRFCRQKVPCTCVFSFMTGPLAAPKRALF